MSHLRFCRAILSRDFDARQNRAIKSQVWHGTYVSRFLVANLKPPRFLYSLTRYRNCDHSLNIINYRILWNYVEGSLCPAKSWDPVLYNTVLACFALTTSTSSMKKWYVAIEISTSLSELICPHTNKRKHVFNEFWWEAASQGDFSLTLLLTGPLSSFCARDQYRKLIIIAKTSLLLQPNLFIFWQPQTPLENY